MAYYGNIQEEELKNKVAHDLFDGFDTTRIIGHIDFCVSMPPDPLGLNEEEPLLWAEAKKGTNHWIPFTEYEVGAQEKFESHFMSDFIHGKIKKTIRTEEEQKEYEKDGKNYHVANAFEESTTTTYLHDGTSPLVLSKQAKAVMDAGRELWRYYHQQPIAKEKPNASFYDIRLYFQGTKTTKSGKQQMNTDSDDPTYTALIADLRLKIKELARHIEPKVYNYGFLRK